MLGGRRQKNNVGPRRDVQKTLNPNLNPYHPRFQPLINLEVIFYTALSKNERNVFFEKS